MSKVKLLLGDCLDMLKELPGNCVDSVVTDPPYELGFMGKKWDGTGIAYSVEMWSEVLRVLKPGGHLLSAGIGRTHHRAMVAIEDAGFEIRDCVYYLFGSGFPKSHNISKAIDRKVGAVREVVGYSDPTDPMQSGRGGGSGFGSKISGVDNRQIEITSPATPEAQQWDGWGTALKPAAEIWVLARKPLSEKTIVENVLKWGTGGINVDGCRVATDDNLNGGIYSNNSEYVKNPNEIFGERRKVPNGYQQPSGRFPANLILDEEAGRMLDEQSGESVSRIQPITKREVGLSTNFAMTTSGATHNDKGGASRYFKNITVDDNDFSMYNIGNTRSQSCGIISESQRVAGILNGVKMEVEKYTQSVDRFITGKQQTVNFQKDTKYIISTLIKQMIELKTCNVCKGENIDYCMAESEKITRLLMGLNIENVKDVEIIKSLIVFKSVVLELIRDTVKIVNENILKIGVRITEENGTLIIENIESQKVNRFWYCAKSSRKERNAGLEGMEEKIAGSMCANVGDVMGIGGASLKGEPKQIQTRQNHHLTVKPISLMRYLCRLITPPNGTVLDPFMGSGTTGCACALEGFEFIGIEREAEYIEIAERRIEYWQTQTQQQLNLFSVV